jgi:hypothetical protein
MCNRIAPLDDVNMLRKRAPALTSLDLRMNPLAAQRAYRGLALRRLRGLARLDGAPVSPEQRATACANRDTLPLADLRAACTFASAGSEEPSLDDAVEVKLEGRGLRRLDCAAGLPALERASFGGNELTSLASLEGCTRLTCLDVSVCLPCSMSA